MLASNKAFINHLQLVYPEQERARN